jgi:hypothetical protein
VSYEGLEIRIRWGDMTLELKGEASAVRLELQALKQSGIGHITDFFALRSLQSTAAPASGVATTSPAVSPASDSGGGATNTPVAQEESPGSIGQSVATLPEPHGDFFGFVIDQLIVPQSLSQALSLGGNVDRDPHNRPDNLIGSVLASLSAQMSADFGSSSFSGVRPHLLRLQTTDPALANDAGASVRFLRGQSPQVIGASPTIDAGAPAPLLFGALVHGKFVGRWDVRPESPISLDLPLAFSDPPRFVPLEILAGHLEFEVDPSQGITKGAIHGAVDPARFKDSFFAVLSDQLTQVIQKNPSSDMSKALITLFQLGEAATSISASDLAASSLLGSLLVPDVRIDGGEIKNLMSIGVGFTGTPATF